MRRPWVTGLALCCVLIGAVACGAPAPVGPAPEQLTTAVLSTRPHAPSAFTQGFEIDDGQLYEGTGLQGGSTIQRSDLSTGAILASAKLPDDFFGEGITVVGDTLWQLTWKNGVALRRDRQTLAERDRVSYDGEGWGLCHQRDRLVMSNGSDILTFRDPVTFAATGTVTVRKQGVALDNLNELECVDGVVWANVWQTDQIVRIDPANGQVTATVDASGLLNRTANPGADVLNGIAAVPGTDRFLLTGKLWPTTFEVRFVPAGHAP